ncbi:maltose alpha-D-glucosyltransferase [Phenylobacterium sp.]|uniref:maltose alpha-D-glucosyltransferase n=1 Tax=Phenylobacterium sp. TaxID=1871053 RepID=UPI0019C05E93|nr:maltose alpha-D-glucosyltransferase [Phenylobacterium sp.]MBC7167104.1 maltose alpha-D-glucosyltransferase [Phenylobacterium sp.]
MSALPLFDLQLDPASDPLWYKDAVIYQLHVKSFFDANDDGVGDFAGLCEKLDYIASLGVTAVWLLPFYPSPRRDDGYDIADYRGVHPEYGTFEDVKRFIDEAHARGMRVITELVINHTSDQHPWFQAARRAPPGSPERDFYVWSDTDAKYDGTRIIFCDTETSNWTWDPVAGAYYWHRFYSHQPDLNFDNPTVLEEVLATLSYWMEAGIDGLRLDAIPYLIEREGTNNENLPETHEVLKKIRAHLDANFEGRMLLAEANQWPEDTQLYFGDGDECNMAFHFPLMPRMYMAIAQEDRFPITDIMRQTPDIPENCQWAIFLRNHDELTLEMVTNKERDYLWSVYAADRRARINLGIRRRLAPLMERDRRRVELMNCLLLTMPGTPVLYYGDEIGMGDNIYLGDRDGVRTPMQWSPDRNGGFSKADPASLVLPTVMDPLYGFQAVNVEAQSRDSHSLLNWVRRMLAVRKRHTAFGRGTLRFLRPHNRKVLAYLREHEGEVILCVANLSRTAQAVELDLSEFAGWVPMEMTGANPFPPIGQLTYLLTLPPYGFHWFELCERTEGPTWSTAPAGAPLEQHTFVLREGLTGLLSPAHRPVLEREVLPAWIPARRWFQGKDGAFESVRVLGFSPLPGGADLMLAEAEVTTSSGTAVYQLPLAVAWEDEVSDPYVHNLALARVRRGARVGELTDGFATADFVRGVLEGFRTGARLMSPFGELEFDAAPIDLPPDAEIEWSAAEQSNSSAIIGRSVVLKLLRKVTPGIHPEAEMTRLLTERGFPHVPPLLGEVRRVAPGGEPRTLMVAQGFVYSQGDGWTWTLEYLQRVVDDLVLAADTDEPTEFATYAGFAETLGRSLAEMHAVLAQPTDDAAFAPERVDVAMARGWAASVVAQLDGALSALESGAAGSEDPDLTALASALVARRQKAIAVIQRFAAAAEGGVATRVHGDLHLGQILVTGSEVKFIDFEGEPAKPLEIRRAKASPLRDVAGMVRSFDYAAATAAIAASTVAEGVEARGAEMVAQFREVATRRFLAAYDEVAGGYSPELLDLFLIEKAAYEITYEAANRPAWIGTPMRGLAEILDRLLGA